MDIMYIRLRKFFNGWHFCLLFFSHEAVCSHPEEAALGWSYVPTGIEGAVKAAHSSLPNGPHYVRFLPYQFPASSPLDTLMFRDFGDRTFETI